MAAGEDPTEDGAPSPEDISEDRSAASERLEGAADAILARGERPRPLRQAMREDAADMRQWARQRGERACEAIRDQPLRATVYALGIGVLIGLLAAR